MFYFFWRKRIPFAAVLLETVMSVMSRYPALFMLSPMSALVAGGYSALLVFTIAGMKLYYGKEMSIPLIIFLLFSWFWTVQVIGNTVHTTIAGVFANYYFVTGSGQEVRNPTLKALRRALTWSFGSICFGSLIVALIQLVRALLQSASDRNSLAAACVDCIMGLIESLVRYFNTYAYTQVAIYGKPFVQAAKVRQTAC